MESISS